MYYVNVHIIKTNGIKKLTIIHKNKDILLTFFNSSFEIGNLIYQTRANKYYKSQTLWHKQI